jgi:hypothetical protein
MAQKCRFSQADAVGTNSSLTAAGAATVASCKCWSQGNSFTKIFSAAARVTGPGLLDADNIYANWVETLQMQQQPNFVPFNGLSGIETVGATEFVNYMLLQSDPQGFLGAETVPFEPFMCKNDQYTKTGSGQNLGS